ncbi:hypothetical protein CHUAL_000862 [Chamberlinius hualienensis]
MNFSNLNNGIRSPRIHRRALTNPNRSSGIIGSQQDGIINPMGQHNYQSSPYDITIGVSTAISHTPSSYLLSPTTSRQRYNNIQRNLDVDRESVDTGIATQLCHPPFHLEQRAVYVWHPQKSMGTTAATDGLYQMKPVIKSRKVIGILDVAQLINDARSCSPTTVRSRNDNIQLPLEV